MDIVISNSSNEPIYRQIENQIKDMIIQGKLKEGDALPSIRLLAKELRISVITTKRAYDELESDGFIETVQGKGSFVGRQNKDLFREEQLKELEEHLEAALKISDFLKLSTEEVLEMIKILKGEI